jgi:hypothetical protein
LLNELYPDYFLGFRGQTYADSTSPAAYVKHHGVLPDLSEFLDDFKHFREHTGVDLEERARRDPETESLQLFLIVVLPRE